MAWQLMIYLFIRLFNPIKKNWHKLCLKFKEKWIHIKHYINHRSLGSRILLFVREHKKNDFGTEPYTFLGTANYVSHDGSKPMNIIWKLDDPIPPKYLKKTNQLVAG